MQNIIFLTITSLLLVTGVLKGQTEITWPYIEAQTNYSLWITSLEVGEQTVITLKVTNATQDRAEYGLNLPTRGKENFFYIEDPVTGDTYPIEMVDSSTTSSKFYLAKGDARDHRLYFPKLPEDLKTINLVGGEKDTFWDFKGIDLSGKSEKIRPCMERCVGRNAYRIHKVKKSINFLISETYNFRLVVRIDELPADYNAKSYISDIQIVDPRMASINYMEYRDEAMNSVAGNIGNTIPIALYDLNFYIWD